MRIAAIIPVYNRPSVVVEALESVAAQTHPPHCLIVVDDGSSDDTGAIARQLAKRDQRVRVIGHGRNRGYGEALRTGFLASRLEFIFFTDADLQFDLTELEHFLPYAGTVDVIAGYRVNRQDPLSRRLIAYAWNLLMRVLFYVPVRDIDCAFKLMDRRVLDEIDIESVGAMVNTELMVKLGRRGASVVEVGVHHRPRRAGRARGATPGVIATAFRELLMMRRRLSSLDGRGL